MVITDQQSSPELDNGRKIISFRTKENRLVADNCLNYNFHRLFLSKILRMRIIFYAICLCIVVSACKQESGTSTEIMQLEKVVDSEATPENVGRLLTLYSQQIKSDPDNTKANKPILLKAQSLAKQHKRISQALSYTHSLVLDYYNDDETPDRVLEIGGMFKSLNKQFAQDAINLAFIETWPDHPEVEAAKGQISSKVESLDTLIASLGQKMFNDSLFRLEQNVARQYVDACEAFALVKQNDPNAAEYLHKAAETARTLRTVQKSLSIYDWILRKYPDHPRAAQALFLKAFTLDNDLKDFENARKFYLEYIDKYPDNDFTSSAQFLLENLGKSDEELLEVLQNKAKESNQE
jgi:tetratricopeptide (TPR) repeat protein